MNKEEIQEKAFMYACGALADEERDSFEDEIRGNRDVQEEAYAWQKVNEQAVLDVEQADLPFHSYAGIMKRIDAEEAQGEEEVKASASKRNTLVSFVSWSGWAVAACAAIVFAMTAERQSSGVKNDPQFVVDAPANNIVLNDLRKPGASIVSTVANVDRGLEDRMLEVADLAEAYWFSREETPVVQVDQAGDANWTDGFTIFDRKYKIGFIGVENMPEKRVGKFYNVWARSESGGNAVWAGSLPMGDASRGLFFFDLSSSEEVVPLDDAVSFFITEDHTDRPDAPQGPVVLGGI